MDFDDTQDHISHGGHHQDTAVFWENFRFLGAWFGDKYLGAQGRVLEMDVSIKKQAIIFMFCLI